MRWVRLGVGVGVGDSGMGSAIQAVRASSGGAVGAVGSRGGDWSCDLLYAEEKRTGALISTIM